jgi:hypothetical protein
MPSAVPRNCVAHPSKTTTEKAAPAHDPSSQAANIDGDSEDDGYGQADRAYYSGSVKEVVALSLWRLWFVRPAQGIAA